MRLRDSSLVCAMAIGCGAAADDRDDGGTSPSSTGVSTTVTTATGTDTGGDGTGTAEGSATVTTAATDDVDESSTDGTKFDLPPGMDIGGPVTYPVRMIPGLISITFYERSGGDAPTPYTFAVDGPELTAILPDPLTDASRDIKGVDTEFYDVYYSDQDGVFDIDGRYLTISGQFQYALPAGGGLNLADIALEFEGAPTEFGNHVASFVALGDNAAPETVELTIDGDLQTHTTMGNTVGATERLRVTLGFESSSGPPG